jgi:hypothetical protein
MKIMQAEMEVEKAKYDQISAVKKSTMDTQAEQKVLRGTRKNDAQAQAQAQATQSQAQLQSQLQAEKARQQEMDVQAKDAIRGLEADLAEAGRIAKDKAKPKEKAK